MFCETLALRSTPGRATITRELPDATPKLVLVVTISKQVPAKIVWLI
jgi:hypothetical protein